MLQLHLARRTLLAFRGPDALRYLNGQVSQEIRGLENSDEVRPACVTDAKGRLQAFVHVCRGAGEGELWLEAPAELEEELEARLGRYLIADDAELENLSAAWELWHLTGTDNADLPPAAIVRKSNRLGEPGLDLWLPTGSDPGLPLMSMAAAEARRIAARIPAWGAELTPGMLPPEAGLDRSAISYTKGCYIGQEVLSRMKSAGKVNRRLTAFLVESGIAPGAALALTDSGLESSKPAGTITSVSPQPDTGSNSGLYPALGYLEKAAFSATELRAGGKLVRVV